ncbi:hypothetical protein [Fibrobacter sp.]|uniref:hypothetical protein n=1 Tax=Fibrobacter sp. TaxID=35828 RepID=UPI0026150959|nr:hypothetical protein [Fibrobacter sp.]MDD5941386.1 hypothetical protein [Fibrobacter sp.]
MTFGKFHSLLLFLLGLVVLAFGACSDSDRYVFDSSEPGEPISVKALLTTSFDSSVAKVKSDTIRPGDSLIFLTEVYPSKSIGHKRYFWLLDGNPFANEFSFRNTILELGIHEVVFVFVDSFGDTLSDTLSVTVANSPALDDSLFIPACGTQSIEPDSSLSFAWNSTASDSISKISYHFVIWKSTGELMVDTLLNQANFIYRNGFTPLHKYYWSVSAENQFHQKSERTIEGYFYVKGASRENAVMGHLMTNSDRDTFTYQLLLQDSNMVPLKEIKSDSTDFSLAPLAEGSYSLRVSIPGHPDFSPILSRFSLHGEQVLELDTIRLHDNKPPAITSPLGSDTIAIADTLRFAVYDAGSGISESMISVFFENRYVQDFSLSDNLLKIPFDKDIRSWTYRIITITAIDFSGNRISKNFYLKPNTTLPEVFGE